MMLKVRLMKEAYMNTICGARKKSASFESSVLECQSFPIAPNSVLRVS